MRKAAVLLPVLLACASLASGQIDISSKRLAGADLRGADLYSADLRGADLRGAELSDADLRHADLERADLSDADLRRANLLSVNLRGADLRRAFLGGANLTRVKNPPDCEGVADLESFCAALRKARPSSER